MQSLHTSIGCAPGIKRIELKAQGRTHLAAGISLDVTDDLQG